MKHRKKNVKRMDGASVNSDKANVQSEYQKERAGETGEMTEEIMGRFPDG